MHPLAPAVGVADAGAIPVALLHTERDRLWIAADATDAAAAWGPGRGSGHERLSPPGPAGFGGSPIDLAYHKQKHSFFSY